MYLFLFPSKCSSFPPLPPLKSREFGEKRTSQEGADYLRMSYHPGGPVRYSPPSNPLKPAKERAPLATEDVCLSECEQCHAKECLSVLNEMFASGAMSEYGCFQEKCMACHVLSGCSSTRWLGVYNTAAVSNSS